MAIIGKFAKKILKLLGFNRYDYRANYIIAVLTDAALCFAFYSFSYYSISMDGAIYIILILNAICFARRIVKNLVRVYEITKLPQDGGKQHGITSIVNIYSLLVLAHTVFFVVASSALLQINDGRYLREQSYKYAVWFLLLTGIDEFFDILVKTYNAEIV